MKKEGHDITLKRFQSQISSDENHEDQERTSQHRALTSTVIKEEAPQQRKVFLGANPFDFQSRLDSIAFLHDNQILYIGTMKEGSKDHKENSSNQELQSIILCKTKVSESRKTI